MVRNLRPLLSGGDLSALNSQVGQRIEGRRPVIGPPSILEWANTVRSHPQILLAAGVLRLTRRFDEASELLNSSGKTPAEWKALGANEEAATAWHRGNREEALESWQAQKSSVPVLFNRGVAALFLGRPADARTALEKAVAQLPDSSTWHHLGHLYLALSGVRS
jgi:tetratricopeptide (TPR) repeat protein